MNSKTKVQIPPISYFGDELIDTLTAVSLKWHCANTLDNIKNLQSKEKLEDWEKEDLQYNLSLAASFRIVCNYYGVETNETKEKPKKQKSNKVKTSKKV